MAYQRLSFPFAYGSGIHEAGFLTVINSPRLSLGTTGSVMLTAALSNDIWMWSRVGALPAGRDPEAGGITSLVSHREACRDSSCVLRVYGGRTKSSQNFLA